MHFLVAIENILSTFYSYILFQHDKFIYKSHAVRLGILFVSTFLIKIDVINYKKVMSFLIQQEDPGLCNV